MFNSFNSMRDFMLQTYSVAGLNDNNGKFFEQEDVEASDLRYVHLALFYFAVFFPHSVTDLSKLCDE